MRDGMLSHFRKWLLSSGETQPLRNKWEVQPKLSREIILSSPYSIGVFTAAWDRGWQHYRSVVHDLIERLGDKVMIGFVDVDVEGDFAREVKLGNVPAIGFFRVGKPVALHIGWHLDVPRMAAFLLEDEDVPRLSLPPMRGGRVT